MSRYSRVAILFHWTIAVLVIANLLIGFFHDAIGLMPQHKAIGITVLLLTLARVAWRLGHRPPPLPATTPSWQITASRVAHWALYLFMIAMPLTGWLMVSGAEKRRPLDWFGLFDIPFLPVGATGGGIGHEGHELLAIPFALLVLIHIAAALKHQFIDRDDLIARMWPARS